MNVKAIEGIMSVTARRKTEGSGRITSPGRDIRAFHNRRPDRPGTAPVLRVPGLHAIAERQDLLETIRCPALLLTRDGVIVAVNRLAHGSYGAAAGATLRDLPFSADSLDEIQSAVAGMACRGQWEARPLRLMRAERAPEPRSLVLSLSRHLHDDLILLQATGACLSPGTARHVQDLFDLTTAEAEVLNLLVGGRTPGLIAEARGTAMATVRVQIRSLLMKTDTHSQLECILMVLSLDSFARIQGDAQENP